MATERQRQLLLAALALVLAFVVYNNWPRTSAEAPAPSNQRAATPAAEAARGRGAPPGTEAPDVHLDALTAERPKPAGSDRNVFRFKAAPAPPPTAVRPVAPPPVAPVPSGPPP